MESGPTGQAQAMAEDQDNQVADDSSKGSDLLARRTSVKVPALVIVPMNYEAFTATPPPGLLTSPQRQADKLALDERLKLAAQRREAFRTWVMSKAQSKRPSSAGGNRVEEKSKLQFSRLKERLAAAEAAREQLLDNVRQRAATYETRRELAIGRLSERQEALAQRVQASLTAAEERRAALLEADRERLRAEHKLVLMRLASSKDEAAAAEAARKRLNERLAAAEEQRLQRLAQAASKAGSKVQHAKAVSALTRQIQQQQAAEKLEQLQARLENAQLRRSGAGGKPPSTATASATTTPRGRRVSVGGSAMITSPPLLSAETSEVSPETTEQDGDADGATAPTETADAVGEDAVAEQQEPDVQLIKHVSQQILQQVNELVSRASMSQPAIEEHDTDDVNNNEQQQDQQDVVDARVEALRRNVSSRKLQAAWRAFRSKQRTTASLVQAFIDTGVISVGSMSRSASSPGAISTSAASASPPMATAARTGSDGPVVSSGGAAVIGALGSPVRAPRGADQFDVFARNMQSTATLRAAGALLRRLEARLRCAPASKATDSSPAATSSKHAHERHHHASKHKRNSLEGRESNSLMSGSASERNVARILRRLYPELPKDRVPDRYPSRILLCSLMIIHYPEVVFNGTGEREGKLADAAKEMIRRFQRLLSRILAEPPAHSAAADGENSTLGTNGKQTATKADLLSKGMMCSSPVAAGIQGYFAMREAGLTQDGTGHVTIAQRLLEFDEAWLQYLDQFAAWKLEDAASLENELVRVACEMERSLQRKLMRSASSSPTRASMRSARNLDSVAAQVQHDYELLRERIEKLSGAAGLARLDAALRSVREQVAAESASEMESASELEDGTDNEKTAGPGTPPHKSPVKGAARGIRRGFFTPSPGIGNTPSQGSPRTPYTGNSTPGWESYSPFASPPSQAASEYVAAMDRSASAPGITTDPNGNGVAPAAIGSSASASNGGANAAHMSKDQPPMIVADVRAPSVGRTPATSRGPSGNASPSPLSPVQLAGDAGQVSETIANLQMAWEVVHNPQHRISSEEADASWSRATAEPGTPVPQLDPEELQAMAPEIMIKTLRMHARQVAEEVFWDNITQRLLTALMGNKVVEDLAGLLSELGTDLADLINEPTLRDGLHAEFDVAHLIDSLGGANCPSASAIQALAVTLQRIAGLLLTYGAPAREAEIRSIHGRLASELGSIIPTAVQTLAAKPSTQSTPPAEVVSLARCISRVLRVLRAQLMLLKLDAANARLNMLSQQLRGDLGVQYLRNKFSSLHALPDGWASQQITPASADLLMAKLPRTAAWIARSHATSSGIHDYIATTGLSLNSQEVVTQAEAAYESAAASAAIPVTLRSGLRATGSSPNQNAQQQMAGGSALWALQPTKLASWDGLIRTGIVGLISSDKPAVSPMLAETLSWDAERLHAAQNSFQQLVVLTAGLLLVQQTRSRAGRAPLSQAELQGARRRIMVVLADPSMSLQALVSELHAIATMGSTSNTTLAPSTNGAAEPQISQPTQANSLSEEAMLGTAFKALMNPSSAAFTSISNALAASLAIFLLLGSPAVSNVQAAGRAVSAILGRVGAGALTAEVETLAKQLSSICSMSARVFGPLYPIMLQPLLANENVHQSS